MVRSGNPAYNPGVAGTVLPGNRLGTGLMKTHQSAVRPHPAAWYNKSEPTFSDAMAAVRLVLWSPTGFFMSPSGAESVEIPLPLLKRFVETLCLAG